MNKVLIYLFDPLCGWCYGASGPLPGILGSTGYQLELLPTGLFSGGGARPVDDAWADYAWANDQRIARLTGQVFSERYREHVLGDRRQLFDSGPATVALTSVASHAPEREFDALKVIQRARYVDGRDITRVETLSSILIDIGLADAAEQLRDRDEVLLLATQMRMARAQSLLRDAGAHGVPTFLVEEHGQLRSLHASAIFSSPQDFARELREADPMQQALETC